MDIISSEYLLSLGSVILLDLVLGGDNAIVIGMAAHKLPEEVKRKVIYYGILGALAIRILMTIAAVGLMEIPLLQFLGGLLLLPIAFKLGKASEEEHNVAEGTSFWEAIKIIIVADALMGIDNVLAIAGVSQGDISLIIIGLLISIPILIWGSQFISKLLHRFSFLIQFGSLVLAWTSATMMLQDPMIGKMLTGLLPYMELVFPVSLMLIVLIAINYKSSSTKNVE